MSKKKVLNLEFPALGEDKSRAYQAQPPYSTFSALNVWPSDPTKNRARGGSRAGLGKWSTGVSDVVGTALGSGNPIRALSQVSYIKKDGLTWWADFFQGPVLGTVWGAASWLSGAPAISGDSSAAATSSTTELGVVRAAYTTFDATSDYYVEMLLVPFEGAHHGDYFLYLRMNDTTPVVTTDGLRIRFSITGTTGAWTGVIERYSGGSFASTASLTSGNQTRAKPAWLRAKVSGTTVTVTFGGTQLYSDTLAAPASGGKRIGFGLRSTVDGGLVLVDTFRHQFVTSSSFETQRNVLIASSNGLVYRENYMGIMDAVSLTLTLSSDRKLNCQEHLQKLYIADYGELAAGASDGTTNGAPGTTFDSATFTDWTSLASAITINANDYVVNVISGTGATAGVYAISAVAAGGITLASSPGNSASAIAFRIARCPKIFNPADNTLTRWMATSGKGTVPQECHAICLYRDRIVLAGDPTAPHVWFMSRQGDPLDWKYSDTDAQRACAGSSNDAGRIGEPIVSLMPHHDDYLIFGCLGSLWILRGDPAFGGHVHNLSPNVGVVDANAWCRGPNEELIFLSRDGVYVLAAGAQTYPQSVSRERLPEELVNLSRNTHDIQLAFDHVNRGVWIFLKHKGTKQENHWWFDWETKGFFKINMPATMEPTSAIEYRSPAGDHQGVLLGGEDGHIRHFSDIYEHDDGTVISSNVIYGPLMSGNGFNAVHLTEIQATLGQDSGGVTLSVLTGDTAEEAVNDSGFAGLTWTLTEGLNYRVHPRARGGAVCVKLANTANYREWSIESMRAVLAEGGRMRKGTSG